jgi:hypothetical protein
MALSAISIQNRAEVRKWAVGRGPESGDLISVPREVTSRGGCAVSTDDENRLTPLRIEVKRQDRDLGIRLGLDGRGSYTTGVHPDRGMR